ncbi:AbrB/MazE/SpoVT family DNA-binding domain-containing protein [Limnofasciculus baicalensis]|uniref:Type II toxin-antitoxin system PrlF family antitoxin n=1 Tax=Limnofasciculus baicalensis BBK-W-15 TaxID=2699891 RepID=A0AAE3KVJ9_9CYAN|nr:type II toxin-antitoxin system PrlF family antitoxin [Limnofasciculus baicalensis]MCP2732692.1 type II toxin-antitoxin system PrlF family antitoxin [Limnofasciculus baicalensis BBK-W-15]
MSIATITSQGETTIPPEIRERLKLHPGDRIRFIIAPDGRVYIQPLHIQVEELSGILHKPNRKPVSIEEMNEAIEQNGGSLS